MPRLPTGGFFAATGAGPYDSQWGVTSSQAANVSILSADGLAVPFNHFWAAWGVIGSLPWRRLNSWASWAAVWTFFGASKANTAKFAEIGS